MLSIRIAVPCLKWLNRAWKDQTWSLTHKKPEITFDYPITRSRY
jgi:hypothetical protein